MTELVVIPCVTLSITVVGIKKANMTPKTIVLYPNISKKKNENKLENNATKEIPNTQTPQNDDEWEEATFEVDWDDSGSFQNNIEDKKESEKQINHDLQQKTSAKTKAQQLVDKLPDLSWLLDSNFVQPLM